MLASVALMGLAACAPQVATRPTITGGAFVRTLAPLPPERPRTQVAVLLPMTGAQAPLGQSMLNATTLALFDAGSPEVELVPRDTGGTASGASEAARAALSEGARVVVGPLTGAETGAAAGQARGASVPVLAFTNDAQQAGGGVWALGVTPAQQVRRLIVAARTAGITRVALAGPEGPFARQLSSALTGAMVDAGLPPPIVVTYPARSSRAAAARQLKTEAGEEGIGLLILAESGSQAREMAAALSAAGLPVPPLRLAGHALWVTDTALGSEPALAGAWIPGPDALARAGFESRYAAAFGERPPRLAATAYDAAALAIRGVRGGPPGAPARLPVGETVQGADGALQLLPNGGVLRALAVYALEPGSEPRLVEPAVLPGAAGS
ncbi:penicillin-binding protein activator [Muricoccus radiodurans]|uniref:penicillin-binding protein activator n=1 Tax=Muricoccus radiodurans TaxID=2231721 RepID=UPI003CF89714